MAPRPRPWFRFYTEAVHDPKLRRLSPEHRWLWVVTLAAARRSPVPGVLLVGADDPMVPSDLADMAALPLRTVNTGMNALVKAGMVEIGPSGAWVVTKWNERQFESDNSTQRAATSRSKQRECNVASTADATPPENRDREQRTHTRAEPQPSLAVVPEPASSATADGAPDGFAEFWALVRLKADKANAAKAWRKATTGPKRADPEVIRARWVIQLKRWDAEGRPREKHPYAATWLNGRRWEDDDLDAKPPSLGPNEIYDTVNLGPRESYR